MVLQMLEERVSGFGGIAREPLCKWIVRERTAVCQFERKGIVDRAGGLFRV